METIVVTNEDGEKIVTKRRRKQPKVELITHFPRLNKIPCRQRRNLPSVLSSPKPSEVGTIDSYIDSEIWVPDTMIDEGLIHTQITAGEEMKKGFKEQGH